jgi:hypothetical protein
MLFAHSVVPLYQTPTLNSAQIIFMDVLIKATRFVSKTDPYIDLKSMCIPFPCLHIFTKFISQPAHAALNEISSNMECYYMSLVWVDEHIFHMNSLFAILLCNCQIQSISGFTSNKPNWITNANL